MAHTGVEQAFRDMMAAHWTHTPVLEQNMQGEAPTNGEPWILMQFPASRITRWPMNERLFREEGGARFVIHLPSGEGTQRASMFAAQLARLFRYAKFGGVETYEATSPFYDDSNDVGGWFLATVVVEYAFTFEEGELEIGEVRYV